MNSPTGSVAVVVALILTLLLSVMAFTMDTGYLYLKQSQYQNAVEAAAMAGAIDLCGDDPVATARSIAEENGIEDADDESTLYVTPGYYDENDVYAEDFSAYVDFEADPDPETPENEAVLKLDGSCCQYNNAVMVLLEKKETPLTGVLQGDTSPIRVRAAAVAFLKRYGLVALGDDGITTTGNWANGYPAYKDEIIHSNSQIQFGGAETFSGDSAVSAVDGISGGPGAEGVGVMELPPIDWDEIEQKALSHGRIYHPAQWPEGSRIRQADWHMDDLGNAYVRTASTYFFCPAEGDFSGATYLFDAEDEAPPGTLVIYNEQKWHTARECRNLTIASKMDMKVGYYAGMTNDLCLTLGAPGSNIVHLYAKGDITLRDRYGYASAVAYQCNGLVILGEKKTTIETKMLASSADVGQHGLRVIADSIEYEGGNIANSPGKILFDGLFGPPCPPRFVKLGRLVPIQ